MLRIAGIDPGLGGAIVVLESNSFKMVFHPIEWTRMPTYISGKSNRVNGTALAAFLRDTKVDMAVVERVGAMPGQGVTSMFTFGHATGTVMGVLAALMIPISLVTPQVWKKRAGLIGKDKDAARSIALQAWPDWRVLDKKGEGQAMADAALIASFGQ